MCIKHYFDLYNSCFCEVSYYSLTHVFVRWPRGQRNSKSTLQARTSRVVLKSGFVHSWAMADGCICVSETWNEIRWKVWYNKVGWKRMWWTWLSFFFITRSYNFFCFASFLLQGGLGKGCVAELWAWEHVVHVNGTAEDVLNQTGWPALWIAVSSPLPDCLMLGQRLKNTATWDRDRGWCLELSRTEQLLYCPACYQ